MTEVIVGACSDGASVDSTGSLIAVALIVFGLVSWIVLIAWLSR